MVSLKQLKSTCVFYSWPSTVKKLPFLSKISMWQYFIGASLVAQLVKNPPAMHKTWVQSLGWEDPLKQEIATHSSILAWRIPGTEEPHRRVHGVTKSRTWLSTAQYLIISQTFLVRIIYIYSTMGNTKVKKQGLSPSSSHIRMGVEVKQKSLF